VYLVTSHRIYGDNGQISFLPALSFSHCIWKTRRDIIHTTRRVLWCFTENPRL